MGQGESLHCAGTQAHFQLAFDQHSDVCSLEMLTAQEPLSHFALFQKAVNTKRERQNVWTCVSRKLYRLCKVQQLIKFLTFRSVHFHPAPFTRPSFLIFRGSGSETRNEKNLAAYLLVVYSHFMFTLVCIRLSNWQATNYFGHV